MANIRSEEATAQLHRKILTVATALFVQKGFERTTFTDIAKLSGVIKSKILYEFSSKEEILGLLVTRFLDGVTSASDAVSKKLTDDKLLIFIPTELGTLVCKVTFADGSEEISDVFEVTHICEHICHSNNWFVKVIWSIANFFLRLFNIQQYCTCGVSHYDAPFFG